MARMNQLKTFLLLALLSGLIVLVGYLLVGDESGLYYGLAFAGFSSFGSWYYSDRAALAAFKAQPTPQEDAPELYARVKKLSDRANLPKPKLYIIPSKSPNAFATGRDPEHSAIALTQGLIDILTPEELDAVIAHELTHVRNRDTLTQAVAGTLSGAITYLGRILTFGALFFPLARMGRRGNNPITFLFLLLIAPLSAGLLTMAISRTREFAADEGAAEITGNPLALVSALEKLEEMGQQVPMNGNPAYAPLFIVCPLATSEKEPKKGLITLFMTHPSTEERIERLKAKAKLLAEKKEDESQELRDTKGLSPAV